jgi:hypothetical protein
MGFKMSILFLLGGIAFFGAFVWAIWYLSKDFFKKKSKTISEKQ